MAISVGVFVIGLIAGWWTASASPQIANQAFGEMQDTLRPLLSQSSFVLFLVIFINNALKLFIATVAGVLLVLAPIFSLLVNGYLLGLVVNLVAADIGFIPTMVTLLPHGSIELPALWIGSALGIYLGVEAIGKLRGREVDLKSQTKEVSLYFFKYLLPIIFVAALIEAFITPSIAALL